MLKACTRVAVQYVFITCADVFHWNLWNADNLNVFYGYNAFVILEKLPLHIIATVQENLLDALLVSKKMPTLVCYRKKLCDHQFKETVMSALPAFWSSDKLNIFLTTFHKPLSCRIWDCTCRYLIQPQVLSWFSELIFFQMKIWFQTPRCIYLNKSCCKTCPVYHRYETKCH